VKGVAQYARRVLEHATALDDPAGRAKDPAVAPSPAPSTDNNSALGGTAPSAATALQEKPPYRCADD
jgi:hypothetical protein